MDVLETWLVKTTAPKNLPPKSPLDSLQLEVYPKKNPADRQDFF
ncbi:hypothetical protein KCTC52924_00877 [Arenibacter antarcticus]|nr:hypothetical protein [Arenibacter sp. H213]